MKSQSDGILDKKELSPKSLHGNEMLFQCGPAIMTMPAPRKWLKETHSFLSEGLLLTGYKLPLKKKKREIQNHLSSKNKFT